MYLIQHTWFNKFTKKKEIRWLKEYREINKNGEEIEPEWIEDVNEATEYRTRKQANNMIKLRGEFYSRRVQIIKVNI